MSFYDRMCKGRSCYATTKLIWKLTICVVVSLSVCGISKYKAEIRYPDFQPSASNMEIMKTNMTPTGTEGQTGTGLTPNTGTAPRLIIDSYRQSVFQNIYNRSLWGEIGGRSGPGSSVEYTRTLRKRLLEFVSRHNLSSMVDIPCGAMEWTEVFLKSVWQERPSFKYTGMDITESVGKQLQEKWKGEPRVTIKLADLVSPLVLSHINADFVLTRDGLQHMTLQDACLAIDNLVNLGDNVKYILIGTYPMSLRNFNIKTGAQHFCINVLKSPFNLPKPYLAIKETPAKEQKFMYVFKMKDLHRHRCQICTTYVKRNNCP